MVYQRLKIVHKEVIGGYTKLSIRDKEIPQGALPGNFAMVKPDDRNDPLLPRPFAILEVDNNIFEILVKVKGKGTKIIAEKSVGDTLFLFGPLGKSFIPPKKGILIAGGIGVASLFFLSKFMEGGIALLGATSKNGIFGKEIFKKRNFDVYISTEDGSMGKKGLITDMLKNLFKKGIPSMPLIGCGPLPMLKHLKSLSENKSLTTYLFLEARMACGIGVCRGCAVRTKSGYKLICKDGPVFKAEDVIL